MASRPRLRRIFEVLSLLSGLGALVVLFRLFGVRDLGEVLAGVSPGRLLVYLLLAVLIRLLFSLRWFLVMRDLAARAPGTVPAFRRFLGARLAGDAVGALIPAGSVGGDPLRIFLLYGRGVEGSAASAGVALDRVLELMGNTLAAVVYVTLFSFSMVGLHENESRFMAAVAVLLGLFLLLVLPLVLMRCGVRPVTPAIPRRWHERDTVVFARRIEDELIALLRERPRIVLWGALASLLIEGLVVLEYHFLLTAFGLDVAWTTLLMMLVTVGLVRVVPVPASLGALEAGQVALMATVRGRADLGFLVGVILRLQSTLWILVGLAVLSAQGLSLARLRERLEPAAEPAA